MGESKKPTLYFKNWSIEVSLWKVFSQIFKQERKLYLVLQILKELKIINPRLKPPWVISLTIPIFLAKKVGKLSPTLLKYFPLTELFFRLLFL